MDIEFDQEYDRRVYAEWTRTLLLKALGSRMRLHDDLYTLSDEHRVEHGQSHCQAWPSPPALAPLWSFLSEFVESRRFLELGCGIGYTAALMADAGGPAAQAEIAESHLSDNGLADRVRVLRGDARDVLPRLNTPYDIVFVDAGDLDAGHHLMRLLHPGGLLIGGEAKSAAFDESERLLKGSQRRAGEADEVDAGVVAEVVSGYRRVAGQLVRWAKGEQGRGSA